MARRSLIHEMEARERRGRWFPALASLLVISIFAATWIGLFSFMSANAAYGVFADLQAEYIPDTDAMQLSLPDLSRVSLVYAGSGELLAELHDGRNSEPVAIGEVPDVVVHAVLAAEDKDFYHHRGVDFDAIASAVVDNIAAGTRRGGSTITQQVVKNYFVGKEVSIRRKINEAFVAAELERRFPKDQILEFYVNSVYFGAGAYGIKAAAREFYGKDLDNLTVDEAATLAVLVRNPTLYNPRSRPTFVLERRDDVMEEMVEEGWATAAQVDAAKQRPLGVIPHTVFKGEADHVVAEVKRQLLNDPKFAFLGANKEERKRTIFGCPADDTACTGGGGLRIETTVDLRVQEMAHEVLDEWLPIPPFAENLELCKKVFSTTPEDELAAYAENHSCAPTGAITTVDNYTGAVLAMASGLPFDVAQFDLAIQGKRNPGSAFKPFGLVAALESGKTLGHIYSTGTVKIPCATKCDGDKDYWQVGGSRGGGFVTLDRATSSSINAVFAQVSAEVGPERIVEVAHRMGIRSSIPAVLSLVLGTGSVSTLEMASAYSNFATNGLWAEPYIISRITDSNGKVIFEQKPTQVQTIDPAVAAAARRPLEKVPSSSGTAPAAAIGRPQGGKTGTHENNADLWYVGFVPQYTTAVWVGYEREQLSLVGASIHGNKVTAGNAFGGRVAGPIWAEYMSQMLEGIEPVEFPPDPPGVDKYVIPPKIVVPVLVGLDQETAMTAGAGFAIEVVEIPALEAKGTVVLQSLDPGQSVATGSPLTIYVSNGKVPAGKLPDLRGLVLEDAESVINDFLFETGLRLIPIKQEVVVTDPNQIGTVVGTLPPPGTSMSYGDQVVLQIGIAGP
ncbi:MAG TPA: transglycosylase domain-containing protein [Acidimicrobiia bacterium]|jgi:penicillin-binding protein 1A